jgi:hypothetical protein
MSVRGETTIVEGARLLARHGGLVEVRLLKTNKGTISGYFDDLEALARAVAPWDGQASIYVTANPVRPDLLARAANRLKAFAPVTTKDEDVLARSWFLVDSDPMRPAGISATDAEVEQARQRRDEVVAFCREIDFPEAVRAMSGNGAHADYAINLPNDPATTTLIEHALKALAARFSDQVVHIDETVFNAARIWKLYGTVAVKGDATADRPHRRAVIETVPGNLVLLPREALERLAAMAPGRTRGPGPRRPTGERLDLVAAFAARSWYKQALPGGKHAVRCPWADQHSGDSSRTETCLFEPRGEGEPWGFDCRHAHCVDRTIRDVLSHLGLSGRDGHRATREEEARARADGGKPPPREARAPVGWRLRLVCAADVAPVRVRWAYRPMLAYGKITLFAGDPDNGKSVVVTDYAARFTRGGTWPDGTAIGEPGGVLFFSAEDDLADTIRPRLEAAGGDPRRLHVAEDVVGPTGKLEMFTLHHVGLLRQALQETGAKLCIIDPTAAYLGKSDSDNNAEMRALLRPVAKLAAELGVIVVVISHLTKAAAVKALYRVQGSIALVGAVRLAYVFVRGLGEDAETRYICPLKVNIAKRPPPVAFRFSTPAHEDDVPRVLWDLARQPAHTLEEMLTGEAPPAPARPARDPEGVSAVGAFLSRELASGPVPTTDLRKAAAGSGVAWRSVERAKVKAGDRIRADAVGRGTRDACYYWHLADHQDRMDDLKKAGSGEESGPPHSRTRGEGGGVADQLQLLDKTHEDSGTSKCSATPPTLHASGGLGGPLPSEPRGRRRRARSVAELHAHRAALREHVEAEGQVPWATGRAFLEARGLTARDVRFLLNTGAGGEWLEVFPTGGPRMLIPRPRGDALPPPQAGEASGPARDTDEDPGF